MSKKSQISVFILIGIVVLIIVGVFLYQRQLAVKVPEVAVPADVAPVQFAVQSCFESTAQDAVLTVASRGGYFDYNVSSAGYSADLSELSVPRYVENGKNIAPDTKIVEQQMAKYVDNNLVMCLPFLRNFVNEGYKFDFQSPKTNVTIGENAITFKMNFPINIYFDSKTNKLNAFVTSVNSNLLNILNATKDFSEVQAKERNAFLFGSLMRLSIDNNLQFETINTKSDMVVTLTDPSNLIKDRPLVFSFALNFKPQ